MPQEIGFGKLCWTVPVETNRNLKRSRGLGGKHRVAPLLAPIPAFPRARGKGCAYWIAASRRSSQ